MQVRTYQKERVQNAVLFFVENTKNVGITKLSKLLYFADIDNYIKRGKSITGLEYNAQERGPVPHDVFIELQRETAPEDRKYNLKNFIVREKKRAIRAGNDECFFEKRKNKVFMPQYFTQNEMKIMEDIADKYRNSLGTEMSEESHLSGKPWELTWDNSNGKGKIIDFDLDFDLNSDTDKIDRIKSIQKRIATAQEAIAAL